MSSQSSLKSFGISYSNLGKRMHNENKGKEGQDIQKVQDVEILPEAGTSNNKEFSTIGQELPDPQTKKRKESGPGDKTTNVNMK